MKLLRTKMFQPLIHVYVIEKTHDKLQALGALLYRGQDWQGYVSTAPAATYTAPLRVREPIPDLLYINLRDRYPGVRA